MTPTTAEIHAYAKRIASHMPSWIYDEKDSKNADGELHWSATLRAIASEARMYVCHQVHAGKSRIIVSAGALHYLTDNKTRFDPYRLVRARRTFAWDRDPARVASEVIKLIEPSAREIAEHYRKACEEHEQDTHWHEMTVAALRPVVTSLHNYQHENHRSDFNAEAGDVSVRGNVRRGRIALEIDGVDAAQVARVIELLRESAHA